MMTIREVMEIVDGKVLVGEDRLDTRVDTACGSDLMSDVLAFVKEKTVLITGLINPHVLRTSEMLDITCIVFSRGKLPSEEMLEVAAQELSTKDLGEFVQTVTKLNKENYDRIQEDISWFIKKFDYRYENESWKNSKDAVERTVNKTRGWCVGKEPAEDQ